MFQVTAALSIAVLMLPCGSSSESSPLEVGVEVSAIGCQAVELAHVVQ